MSMTWKQKPFTLLNIYRSPSLTTLGFQLPGAIPSNTLAVGDLTGWDIKRPMPQAGLDTFIEDTQLTCLQSCSSPPTFEQAAITQLLIWMGLDAQDTTFGFKPSYCSNFEIEGFLNLFLDCHLFQITRRDFGRLRPLNRCTKF